MKTLSAVMVTAFLLLGSSLQTMARTSQGDRLHSQTFPLILQNRDCKGDKDDDCK